MFDAILSRFVHSRSHCTIHFELTSTPSDSKSDSSSHLPLCPLCSLWFSSSSEFHHSIKISVRYFSTVSNPAAALAGHLIGIFEHPTLTAVDLGLTKTVGDKLAHVKGKVMVAGKTSATPSQAVALDLTIRCRRNQDLVVGLTHVQNVNIRKNIGVSSDHRIIQSVRPAAPDVGHHDARRRKRRAQRTAEILALTSGTVCYPN